MAGITYEQAEANLTIWLEAQVALATSQSYTIEENDTRRTVTRADLSSIQKMIDYWNTMCMRLNPKRNNGGYAIK